MDKHKKFRRSLLCAMDELYSQWARDRKNEIHDTGKEYLAAINNIASLVYLLDKISQRRKTMAKETKYIVIPKDSFTYQELGDYLTTYYSKVSEPYHFVHRTVPKDGFSVPHAIITTMKQRFADWDKRVELYSKEGGGEEREYSIPSRNKCADEKRNLAELNRIKEKKKASK